MRTETYTGVWWLPANPDRKVAGTLDIRPDELAVLRLLGAFKKLPDFPEAARYPRIHGMTPNGTLITLNNGFEVGATINSPGFLTEEIGAPLVIANGHFPADATIDVRRAWIEFRFLEDWVGAMGLTDDLFAEHHRIQMDPGRFPAVRVGPADVTLSTSLGSTGDRVRGRGFRINRAFDLTFDEPIDFVAFVADWLQPLQNFLTLAVGEPSSVTRIRFRSPSASTNRPEDLLDAMYAVRAPVPSREKPPNSHEMLFTYAAISEEWETVIPAWFHVASTLGDVCDLYFSTRYATSYQEPQFLNLAQALEVYHRRRFSNEARPPADHEQMVANLLAAAPADDREWLSARLEHSNEPSLPERLREILPTILPAVAPILPKPNRFIRKVVDTRNYYTHYDPSLAERAAVGPELHWVNETLSFLIEACLLVAMDLDPTRIAGFFARRRDYAYLRQEGAAN